MEKALGGKKGRKSTERRRRGSGRLKKAMGWRYKGEGRGN